MKKLLITLSIATFMSTQALAKDIVIGAPVASFANKGLTYVYDGMEAFDAEHDDVIIKLADANDDPAKMLNDVDNFINAGVDALLVLPTDLSILRPIIKKAERAGIPLIVSNRTPSEEDLKKVDQFTGSQSIQSGILQAEEVVRLLDGKPARVGIILGSLGHEAQIKRTAGNMQVFDKHDNIEVVIEQEARWDRAKAIQIAEDWFQSDYNLNVIVANNDEMAIGALLAANKKGYKDEDLIIAGVDATPDALKYLGEGLDATVFQAMTEQGYHGAKAAYEISKGMDVEKQTWIDYEIVKPENVDEYIARYSK